MLNRFQNIFMLYNWDFVTFYQYFICSFSPSTSPLTITFVFSASMTWLQTFFMSLGLWSTCLCLFPVIKYFPHLYILLCCCTWLDFIFKNISPSLFIVQRNSGHFYIFLFVNNAIMEIKSGGVRKMEWEN